MQLTTKTMSSPLGIQVSFETAPVSKFHVHVNLLDPSDPYRMAATITMPEDREDLWLDGVVSAFRRMQNLNRWTLRLDYANVTRFFNLDQLHRLDQRNPDFSMFLYGVPKDEMSTSQLPSVSVISTKEFNRMYERTRTPRSSRRKEAAE